MEIFMQSKSSNRYLSNSKYSKNINFFFISPSNISISSNNTKISYQILFLLYYLYLLELQKYSIYSASPLTAYNYLYI